MSFLGPLPAFNFYIMLVQDGASPLSTVTNAAGAVLGGFSECSGLDSELSIEERLVGGINDRVFRFPGRAAFTSVTLKRGIAFSEDLYLWHQSFLRGEGVRRNGLIFLANETRIPIKTWSFERGIPKKWVGPSLSASSSALAFEALEIAHEKLALVASPGMAAAGALDLLF